MSEKDIQQKPVERGLDIIKSYRQNDYADVPQDVCEEFKKIIASVSGDERNRLFESLLSTDETSYCTVKTKLLEAQGFNLNTHIDNLINGLDLSSQQKKQLQDRCKINNDIIYGYSIRRLYSTSEKYPPDAPEHINGVQKIERLIADFTANDSSVAKQLKNILEKYPLEISIAKSEKEDTLNGSADFYNGKIELVINDKAINSTDELPGLLAHELSHVIDFTQRPDKYLGHMAGEESFADLCGQVMAEKAGYDSRPWARYMKDNDQRDYYAKGIRPSGGFRYDTILLSESDEKSEGTNFAEKINKDILKYAAVRSAIKEDPQYYDADPEKARLNRVLASTGKIFGDIAKDLQFKEHEINKFPKNKYCLMGVMKQLKKFEGSMPMNIIPDTADVLQSNAEFIKHCLNNNQLKQYVRVTEDINSEKNLMSGTMFVMTNIDKKESYDKQAADDLTGSNHANIVTGRSSDNGRPLLSAFSEERVGYQPKTFVKGYLVDIPRYLKDYKQKNMQYSRAINKSKGNIKE